MSWATAYSYVDVKVKVPYPYWGVGGVLFSLSMAIKPVGG